MAQPMAAAQPIQPGMVKPQVVGYQQPVQQGYPQPMVQQGYPQTTTTVITMGGGGQQPPPGAPPGGVWRQMNYCGPVTWLIGIFFFWCIVFCPVDTRLEYVVGGVRYGPAGEILGDC